MGHEIVPIISSEVELTEEWRLHEHLVDGVAAGGVALEEGAGVQELKLSVESPRTLLVQERGHDGTSHRAQAIFDNQVPLQAH